MKSLKCVNVLKNRTNLSYFSVVKLKPFETNISRMMQEQNLLNSFESHLHVHCNTELVKYQTIKEIVTLFKCNRSQI